MGTDGGILPGGRGDGPGRFNKGDNDDLLIFSQYLGRWWLQDKFAELSDLGGRCRSQVYSVNYVNNTLHRQTDYRSLMSVLFTSTAGPVLSN